MSDEIKKPITEAEKQHISEVVKEVIKTIQQSNGLRRESSFFQKTEKLLYSYLDLKEAIAQKESAIQYLERYGLPNKSKSVVIYSSTGCNPEGDAYMEMKEGYRKAKELTEWLVKKIESALDTIREDRYFFIIEEKYFNKATNEELSERLELQASGKGKLGSSERTIQRNKRRLVQKVAITLFGAGALEDICQDII